MEVWVMRCVWACLCAAAFAARAEGSSLVTLKSVNSEQIFTYDFTLDIINRIYNRSLLNPQSHDYTVMYEEVSSALYSVFGCSKCDTRTLYQGITAMTFSEESGSVLVKATLKFRSDQTNAVVLKALFERALSASPEMNGLRFDPKLGVVVSSHGHHNAASPSRRHGAIAALLSSGLLFLLGYSF